MNVTPKTQKAPASRLSSEQSLRGMAKPRLPKKTRTHHPRKEVSGHASNALNAQRNRRGGPSKHTADQPRQIGFQSSIMNPSRLGNAAQQTDQAVDRAARWKLVRGFAGRQDGSRDQGCVPLPCHCQPHHPHSVCGAGGGRVPSRARRRHHPSHQLRLSELGLGGFLRLGSGTGGASGVQSFH